MTHTLQQDFEHFLSYSDLSSESEDVKAKLLKAYEANWKPRQDVEFPQPYIGAITLLESIAEHGAQAKYDDGTPTPNSVLCKRLANQLRIAIQDANSRVLNSQEIWGLAVQFSGTQVQWNMRGDQQVLVFETPEAFADCFMDVLYSIQHPDTVRLDWLQSKMRRSSIRLADMTFKTVNAWAITADGTDLRATIDAVKAFEENQNER